MKDFAAIDFETANFQSTSVCSVGVVIVRDGEIKDSFYSLIQPEPNYYNRVCTGIHGLCRQDTEEAPVFPKVWKEVEKLIRLSDEDAAKLGTPYLPLVATTRPLTKVASGLFSDATRWIIRTMSSTILYGLQDECSRI